MAKIFYVEDDPNLGFVTKDSLEEEGFEIVHFSDGKEAWKFFKKEKFDLCLLDVNLPELDGFSLAEKIRTQNSQIPIIFLTAKTLQEDKIAGLKIGGDDYITKPFSIEELVLRIKVFLKRNAVQILRPPLMCFLVVTTNSVFRNKPSNATKIFRNSLTVKRRC
jgi:DNA-binding response OmpR family regulator